MAPDCTTGMGAKLSRKKRRKSLRNKGEKPVTEESRFRLYTEEINRFERTGFQPLRAVVGTIKKPLEK
jgi:hypothetical protein